MTVTIQLSDEQAAVLQGQAAQDGLTVAAWLQRLAEEHAESSPSLPTKALDQRPIWEVIVDLMKDVPREVFESLPTDGASEHDHYIYGTPKRNQG